MSRTHFMIGVSALAFAAGASAQTTTANGDTTDANTGNRVVVSCTTGSGNTCSVTQSQGTTFSSSGSVNAAGSNNTSTVNQTGNRQYAENRATGNRNSAAVTQGGFNNSSSISQTGSITSTTAGAFANSAIVNQGNQTAGNGNNNIAQIVQVRTAGAADSLGSNSATVTQGTVSGGFNNTGITTQNGTALTSTITQTDQGNGVRVTNNSATVSQTSSAGASSTVTQTASGNVASVSMFGGNNTANTAPGAAGGPVTGANISGVTQGNTLFGTSMTAGAFTNTPTASGAVGPNTGNLATVAITGLQNNSTVNQNGVQNTVDQSILNGGPGNTSAANASGTNPGTGDAFPANRPEGNSSSVTQTGRGNYAATSIGGRSTTGGGSGNITSITQNTLTGGPVVNGANTTATSADAAVTQTTLTSTQTANSGHRALVYQRGILDQVSISQSSNAVGGNSTGAAGTVQAGSLADVATLSFNSSTTVNQTGTNTARVTQGARTETTGADNFTRIGQTDAGDIVTSGSTGGSSGGFGGTAGTPTSSTAGFRNAVEVAQYGIQNFADAQQNAINASGTIFQAVGTRSNRAQVYQGAGASFGTSQSADQRTAAIATANRTFNAQNLVASISQTAGAGGYAGIVQNGRNLTATATQAGGTATVGTAAITASNNVILLSQAFDYNSASVSQSGTGLSASVEQRGTGSGTLQNLVTITQTNSNNSALAMQTTTAGFSGASGATAGVPNDVNFPNSRTGANSAEIVILQSGTGGSATVEQRGKGQYASITQTGTRNTGGILQDTGATNAVAVLTQSGTDNTYYITQSLPGQYIRVTQSGTNNSASIINGPSGPGNDQAGTPQTRPNFTSNTPPGPA